MRCKVILERDSCNIIRMSEGKAKYLTKTSQYTLVHSRGSYWSSNLLVMKALPNGLDYNRCGFVVSKKVGKAVIRNRVKRLLREVVRQTPVKPGWDIVFIARPNTGKSSFAELRKLVWKLLLKAGLLAENYEETCLSPN
jgi:ribonuclease P protein component